VDALSQKDKEISSYAISVLVPDWLDEIQAEYAKDSDTYNIINNIIENPKLLWKNDIL
jgi:hypothetical protein